MLCLWCIPVQVDWLNRFLSDMWPYLDKVLYCHVSFDQPNIVSLNLNGGFYVCMCVRVGGCMRAVLID